MSCIERLKILKFRKKSTVVEISELEGVRLLRVTVFVAATYVGFVIYETVADYTAVLFLHVTHGSLSAFELLNKLLTQRLRY